MTIHSMHADSRTTSTSQTISRAPLPPSRPVEQRYLLCGHDGNAGRFLVAVASDIVFVRLGHCHHHLRPCRTTRIDANHVRWIDGQLEESGDILPA